MGRKPTIVNWIDLGMVQHYRDLGDLWTRFRLFNPSRSYWLTRRSRVFLFSPWRKTSPQNGENCQRCGRENEWRRRHGRKWISVHVKTTSITAAIVQHGKITPSLTADADTQTHPWILSAPYINLLPQPQIHTANYNKSRI